MNDSKYTGDVVWFQPRLGFGFITWEKDGVLQKDLFAHFSDVVCDGFKTLFKGQKVTFTIGVNLKGDPKATNIAVLKT